MLDVSVKTLDGQNKSYSVPESTTVKQFKEKIASSIEIPVDRQRLIFQGRVLQDEKKLTDYDVHGKVIHVVQRPPPGSRPPASNGSSSGSRSSTLGGGGGGGGASFSFGSFGMPGEPLTDPNHVQNIVQQVLSGMGESGRHAHVTSRTSTDGSAVDVHINLNQTSARVPSEAQQRIKMIQRMLRSARQALHRYNNPNEPESSTTASASNAEETQSGESASQESSSVQSGTTDTGTSTTSTTSTQTSPTRELNPRTAVLGNLMNEVFELQQSMQPLMERYRQVLIDDPQLEAGSEECISTQRLVNTVGEVMHHVGHAYHAISDIMLDVTSCRPRELTAPPTPSPPPTAVIHQTIPVQAQISLNAMTGSPRTIRRNTSQTTSATTSSSTSSSTTTTSNNSSSTTNQTNSTSRQPPFGVRLPAGNMPSGGTTLASTNPYVFMEVGPNTMSFNSVTAHLVSNGSDDDSDPPIGGATTTTSSSTGTSTTAGGTPTSGQNNPVMQNIIQMALQAASQRIAGQPQGGAIIIGSNGNLPSSMNLPGNATTVSSATTSDSTTTTTSSSNSRTNTTTSSTQNGSRSGGNGGMPPMPGLLPFELRNPDPYLPCQSRHFQTLQAELQRQNQNSESTVSNIISALLNQPNPHLTGGAPTTVHSSPRAPAPAPPSTAASTTTTSSSTTRAANPFAALFTPPNRSSQQNTTPTSRADTQDFARRLGDILAQGRNSSNANSESTNRSQQRNSSNPPMSDAMFSQLVSQIGANFSQAMVDGGNSPTIADVLQNITDFNVGEGLLPELLVIVGQSMTFSDLLQVFFGSSQPLGRLRQPLHSFVQEKVLKGRRPTQEVISESVEEAIENLEDYITAIVTESEGDIEGDIDLRATLQEFVRVQLTAVLQLIVNSQENDPNFGDALFNQCRTAIHEDVALLRYCLTSGIRGVERVVRNRIHAMSDVDNPMVQTWVENMASQQLYQLVPQITVSNDQIQRYIIRRSQPMESSPRLSESSHMSTESTPVPEETSSAQEAVCRGTTPQSVEMTDAEETAATKSNGVVNGNSSESWQRALPEEWVPIISRDIQTQRRQAQQQPFSDAYIAGVPAKRRKMMSNSRVPSTGNLSTVIPETIKRAVAATQSTPFTSIESLERDASENRPLQAAYEEQVMTDITERLQSDPDYKPDNYPSSEEYFSPELNTKK